MENDFEALRARYGTPAGASTAPRNGPQLVKGGVITGKALNLAKPSYPAEARQVRAGGAVPVEVLIDETGNVIHACALKAAHPALMESAEIAAYRSKFIPTLLAGSAVKVFGTIVYNFVP
jgi:TonB family protein